MYAPFVLLHSGLAVIPRIDVEKGARVDMAITNKYQQHQTDKEMIDYRRDGYNKK